MILKKLIVVVAAFLLLAGEFALAAVLPDERLDALYHSYDGGGVQVTGPSILVRKGVTTSTSAFYNFYIDNITSASIDVQLGGSKYTEERTEQTLGVDYLHGKTKMNMSFTDSSENDYKATTISVGVSQDFFGDLTTLNMGYSNGSDTVGIRNGPDKSSINRNNYRVSLAQVLSKKSTITLAWETITDEATSLNVIGTPVTLNNPYRSYSYLTTNSLGDPIRGFASEKYPRTRTSNALAIRGAYFIEPRSAIHAEARIFQDSWGVEAFNYQLNYVKPIGDFLFDIRYRHYEQTKADFYRDLFDRVDQFDFMARDKELSSYSDETIGVSVSYEFARNGWGWVDKGSLNLSWDHIMFNYTDYRDATQPGLPGTEPLYAFDADVIQAFISIWY